MRRSASRRATSSSGVAATASSTCSRRIRSVPYPVRITDRLEHWAARAPDRVFLAERDAARRPWRTRHLRARRWRACAASRQALLDRGCRSERPILILSGNSIDHGLLALAAMYVGVLYAPIAPAYSLQASDFATLEQIFERMRPGLVFAADGARVRARRSTSVLPPGVELVVVVGARRDCRRRRSPSSSGTPVTAAVDDARATRSVPTRSPRSCSRRDRPAGRRASSTRSGCSARTRR